MAEMYKATVETKITSSYLKLYITYLFWNNSDDNS